MQHTHDEVAYTGYAYSDTHPDRIAVMAMLHGLQPPPVDNCRVLEIGCNEGSNIIPMAYAIPGSEFVGFDVAELPIARAQRTIDELAITNIRVLQADITDIDASLGKFDYIIAHGVYAWIREETRDSLLALCRNHLAVNGIAFVSYNALPGGYLRSITRDILKNRVAATADPMEGVRDGIALLNSIVELRPHGDILSATLAQESRKLQGRYLEHIFHDELSPEQRPVLFSDFAAHAARHGLRYLSEAVVMPPDDPSNQPQASELAREFSKGDRIAEEQILDFIRMREYRQTLLCHQEAAPITDIDIDTLKKMRFVSQAQSSANEKGDARVFTSPTGPALQSENADVIMVLDYLISQWPRSVAFSQLDSFLAESNIPADDDFLKRLLYLVAARVVELHVWDAPVSGHITGKPRASASSRQEAQRHEVMTSLYHRPMRMRDDLVKEFLGLLDGTRNCQALADSLRAQRPGISEASVMEGIDTSLQLLHRSGVLVADGFRQP